MTKFFLIFLSIILFTLLAEGQEIVWNGNAKLLPIDKEVSILEDTSGTLNINQVNSSLYSKKFILSNQSILHFGFTNSVYWIKFELKNSSKDSLLLSLDQAFVPSAMLYYKDSINKWKVIPSGYYIPLSQKRIIDHYQLFPLHSNNTTYYLRLKPYVHAIPINILERNYWYFVAARQKMSYGIYAGILLFVIVINIFLFIALRKIYFLNYSILVFFYLLTSALVMEGYAVYFFPKIDLMWWYKVVPVLDMPALLFYCIYFFELRKNNVLLFKVALYSALFFISYLFILNLLPLLFVLLINQVFALLVFVLGICIGLSIGKAGNSLGYIFAASYTLWFLLILTEAIYIQTGVPKHFSPISYVSIAIFVEAFLLAFLQAKRFEWERKDDHLKQFAMKSKIERMEKDFQNEILKTKLEIQEQTFTNISQEIHDNVGQTLSLAKLQVGIMERKNTKDEVTLKELNANLGQALCDLRDLAKSLNSEYVMFSSLPKAVEHQAQRINRIGTIKVFVDVEGSEGSLGEQKKLIVFRIIQESIQNVIKHANASNIKLLFNYTESFLDLTIEDDGVGFDTSTILKNNSGLGLQNIISRADIIGGNANINSYKNKGTIIRIKVPYIT